MFSPMPAPIVQKVTSTSARCGRAEGTSFHRKRRRSTMAAVMTARSPSSCANRMRTYGTRSGSTRKRVTFIVRSRTEPPNVPYTCTAAGAAFKIGRFHVNVCTGSPSM